jgi:predicted TIM-barrel fold metal-dependent hydrolase
MEPPWRERIVELARPANVAAKISGVAACADKETWTLVDLRPSVEHAIMSFGWDRVVWGGDWPARALTASLSIWVAATDAIVKGCSSSERDRLFCGAAMRIWRLAA